MSGDGWIAYCDKCGKPFNSNDAVKVGYQEYPGATFSDELVSPCCGAGYNDRPKEEIKIKNCIKGATLIRATQIRIDNKEIADNHHLYSIRHSDDDMSNPLTIEKIVVVNHFCDIVLDKPLRHLENPTGDRYLELNDAEKEVIEQAIEEDESLGRPF